MANALFVMAKDPRAGQVKTRLCPPLTPDTAARLYRCFLDDVLDLVADLPGIDPVVAYTPADAHAELFRLAAGRFLLIAQHGADLGERLENTFRALFERGYDRVAAVSTDSPDLPRKYLEEAFDRLQQVPVVLGPCPDGGYYLIGLSRLVPELFRAMPWSTDQVCPETVRRVQALRLAHSSLSEWDDVDTAEDLDRLVRTLRAPANQRAPRTADFCRQELRDWRMAAHPQNGMSPPMETRS